MNNVKRHTIIIIAVSFLLLSAVQDTCGASEESPRSVGRISALTSGSRTVLYSERDTITPRLFRMVKEGDMIETAQGSKVRILFYETYREEEIRGEALVQITAKGCVLKKGKGTITTTRKPPQTEVAANPAGRGKEIAGITCKKPNLNMPIKRIFPVANTMDNPAQITITWKAPDALQIPFYTVTVTDIDNNIKIVKEEIITETTYTLPKSSSPLKPGSHYSFEIKGYPVHPKEPGADFQRDEMAVTNPPYSITVPSKQAIAFINNEEKKNAMLDKKGDEWLSASLFLMSLYIEYGLDDRAAKLAKELRKDKRVAVFFAESRYMEDLINCHAK